MPDRHVTSPSASPEEMLDQWLDALNDPGRSAPPTPPAGIGDLATVAREYRQVLGVPAFGTAGRSTIAERNGSMNHAPPAAPDNGTWMTIGTPRRHHTKRRRPGWNALLTQGLATAVLVALLVGLVGGAFLRGPGLPGGSDEPTSQPGLAASPEATPQEDTLSCASPGYRPIVSGDVDPNELASVGELPVAIAESEDGITLTMADGTEHQLPPGDLSWSPGITIVLHDDGARTVLNPTIGESWTFEPVEYADFPDTMQPHAMPFAQAGPFVAGPIVDNGLNWRIIDTRTGESRETADILGGEFPHAAQAFTLFPHAQHPHTVVSLRFREVVGPLAGSDGPAYTNIGATLVIPGDLTGATFVDHDQSQPRFSDASSPMFASPQNVLFNSDRTRIAWSGWQGTGDGFGAYGLFIADARNLANPTLLLEVNDPATLQPVMFNPSDTEILAFVDGTLTIIDADNGETRSANVDGLTTDTVHLTNPDAGTLIFNGGTPESPEVWLYDATTDEARRLPQLDDFRVMYPLDTWNFAVAQKRSVPGSPSEDRLLTIAIIDTHTGDIVSTTEEPVEATGSTSQIQPTGTMQDGMMVTGQPDGTLLIRDGQNQREWTMPLPSGIDAASNMALDISPGSTCLLLSIQDRDSNVPETSYIIPLDPNAEWTELDFALAGWWNVDPQRDQSELQTLPAQDFGTPVASPVATPVAFELSYQVAGVTVNLRAAPTTASAIVDALPPRTPLDYLDEDAPTESPSDGDRWMKVATEDGRTGWIREIDLKPLTDSDAPIGSPPPAVTPLAIESDNSPPTPTLVSMATPEQSGIDAMLPDNAIPVVQGDPPGSVGPSLVGTIDDDGLTIPLLNGETLHLPGGQDISQVPFTTWAIVTFADGTRQSIDLETGDTLAKLPAQVENERFIGAYLFAPANAEMTNWNIIDVRIGDLTDTVTIGNGPFDESVTVRAMPSPLGATRNIVVQFALEMSAGDFAPWQGLATDEGPPSGTLIIPGNLADARFLDGAMGSTDFRRPNAAISSGDEPLVAYVTRSQSEHVRLENAVSGEVIATWSDRSLHRRMSPVYFAGFASDGESLTSWVGFGGYGPDFVNVLSWPDAEPHIDAFELDLEEGAINFVTPAGSGAFVKVTDQDDAALSPPVWKRLDLDSGDWRDLPELDGHRLDRYSPGSDWMVFTTGPGLTSSSTVIVDATRGEIETRLEDPDIGMSIAISPARDFSVIVITGNTGEDETTGYVLDARRGESWRITPPAAGNIVYDVSPDGSLLIAEGPDSETWIAPLAPDSEWTSLGQRSIEQWLWFPDDRAGPPPGN